VHKLRWLSLVKISQISCGKFHNLTKLKSIHLINYHRAITIYYWKIKTWTICYRLLRVRRLQRLRRLLRSRVRRRGLQLLRQRMGRIRRRSATGRRRKDEGKCNKRSQARWRSLLIAPNLNDTSSSPSTCTHSIGWNQEHQNKNALVEITFKGRIYFFRFLG
jgi:hypothetical protein